MTTLRNSFALCVLCPIAFASPSLAGGNFEWLGTGIAPLDVSSDGKVIVGNVVDDGSYETARWTQATGWVRLGRASVPVLGVGGGSPDVSYDGTVVSAEIIDASGSFSTSGRWVEGQGWTDLLPPTGPDGAICDLSLASTWGLSGDGTTVVGFYWASCKAHPFKHNTKDGLIPLPWTPGVSARVNAANIDGSVVGGWSVGPGGVWQPTVWRDGAMTVVSSALVTSMVNSLSDDGSVIAGSYWNGASLDRIEGSVWTWNGTSYDQQYISPLPGTPLGFNGRMIANAVSGDGSIVVGTNYFFWNGPFSAATGFVWTQDTGAVDVLDILNDIGHPLPTGLQVGGLTSISQDGRVIVGYTQDTTTFELRGFRLTLPPAGCDGDADGNESVDVNDISYIVFRLGNSGDPCLDGDVDGDGNVNVNDISYTVFRLGTCSQPTSCQ